MTNLTNPFTRHFAHWPPNQSHSLTIPATSLYTNLEISARRYPTKAATIYYDSQLSYADLRADVDALAAYLQQVCGVKRGDRVLLHMQNCPQFFIGYYAILRADAFIVPVNPMLKSDEVKHFAQDSQARVALVAQELLGNIAPLIAAGSMTHAVVTAYSDYLTTPTTLTIPDFVKALFEEAQLAGISGAVPWRSALNQRLAPAAHLAGPDDWCVMPYTSGTTGKPKGCIHTHRSVMFTTVAQALWNYVSTESVHLAVLPLFHVTGMQGSMNAPLYTGGTIVIFSRWDRDAAAAALARYKITHWTNIPTMVVDFLANPKLGDYDVSSLTRIGGGGAAMPEAVAQKIKDLWGLSYMEGYGLSETIAPTHINPPQRSKKQCLGIPIYDTEARLIDPDSLVELDFDTARDKGGEIVVSGPQVFVGYWRDEEKSKAAFFERDGKRFFRTGDLGRIDEEGYYTITDRLKRMINASGFKVWPAEVELMMYAHPDIQEACIIGTQDSYRGETVKAVVVLKAAVQGSLSPDAQGEAIIAWCKERMAAYKYPRVVEFVSVLPKTATGKVQWRLLQEAENAKAAT